MASGITQSVVILPSAVICASRVKDTGEYNITANGNITVAKQQYHSNEVGISLNV